MKILFAVSLTEPAECVRQVEGISERLNADLFVLHVAPTGTPNLASFEAGGYDPTIFGYTDRDDRPGDEEFRFDSRVAFDRFVERRFTKPVKTMLREGPDPATVIIDDLNRLDADILVLGQKPHPFLERLVLGSVSQKVLKSVRVPTLLIPIDE